MAIEHESDASRASMRKQNTNLKPNSRSSKSLKSKFVIPKEARQVKEYINPKSDEFFNPDTILDSQKEFEEQRGLES